MHIHQSTFGHGQIVYLKTDEQQFGRMITKIGFEAGGTVVYYLALGAEESYHQEIEISPEPCMQKKLGLNNQTQES